MSYDYERKKTTNTRKKQNFFRKMGESAEAISTIFFSQKILSMVLWKSSLKEDVATNIKMT